MMFSLLAIAILAFVRPVHAPAPTSIAVSPALVTDKNLGDVFSVNVEVDVGTNELFMWVLSLSWNPAVLTLNADPIEGSFVKDQVGATIFTWGTVDNTAGYVEGVTCASVSQSTATGSGVIATFQFRVVATGSSDLHLYGPPSDPTKPIWLDVSGNQYNFDTVTDGSVIVGLPIGNLIAVSMEPVQVVWGGGNLVKDKATDFRISYTSTFSVAVETEILVEAPGFVPSTYQFMYKFAPGSHSFVIGSEIASSPFFLPNIKPDARFKFTIDPSNLIWETNEMDNVFPSGDLEARGVSDTKPLKILFVAVRFDGEDGYPYYFNGFSRVDFEEQALESARYLKATYPLAESEVSYYAACFNAPVNAGPRPTTEEEANTRFVALLQTLALRAGAYYDRVVGVVRSSWFAGIPGWSNTIGFAGQGWGRGAVVTLGYWKTTAHEIGHTYDLGHSNDDGDGYYVMGRSAVTAQTFMSTGDTNELPVPPNPPAQDPYKKPVPNFWIRTPEYQSLLTRLTEAADPEILLISATFWRNGTVELGNIYRYPYGTSDYAEGGIGNYYVAQVDGFGNILSIFGITVSFDGAISGRSFDEVNLAFSLPYAGGTKTIQIRNAIGQVVASRVVSDNVPTVHLISPNGGEVLTSDQVQVSWESSDLDGDSLVYNLLISDDGGVTWNPIETGLKQTTFNLLLTGFSGGSRYAAKVVASDGANTAEDLSDGFFTVSSFKINAITPAQTVPLGGKVNYVLNITSYGGFSNSITMGATSSTTDKLLFNWLDGSTIAPVPDGSITTTVEVEAPIATEGGNHTLIFSGTYGNNVEVAKSYLFTESHDIAVTSITSSKTVVGQGFSTTLNVSIQNQGNFGETFSVSLYGNQTLIRRQSTYVSPRSSSTITLMWNTTGFAKSSYTISAVADTVSGEIDTGDNTLGSGTVIVAMPCDVAGSSSTPPAPPDGRVNYIDVFWLLKAYGSDPTKNNWNPNLDFAGSTAQRPELAKVPDNKVNYIDVFWILKYYGKTSP